MSSYLHGIQILEAPTTPPIATASTSVIGLVGTAAQQGGNEVQLNTPVLITSLAQGQQMFGKLDPKNPQPQYTIPQALAAIFNQASASVVVVNVGSAAKPADAATGANALLQASSVTGYTPKILLALVPYGATTASQDATTVATAIASVTQKLSAIAVIDVYVDPTSKTAITDATKFAAALPSPQERLYPVFPGVKDLNGTVQSASPYVAGAIASSDAARGFWWSPSNYTISAISGASLPIAFSLGDPSSDANTLNQGGVATIIQQQGYRLWGDRSAIASSSSPSSWVFLSVRRTADALNESLLQAHFWAIDQNITKNYVDSIESSVNSYLRSLKAQGAIIDGKCWADPNLNTPTNIQQGLIYFNFDFTPPYPAEHITFTSELVNTYLTEVFS